MTIGWAIEGLHERSFGFVLFLLAMIGLVPGLSAIIGLLIVFPAAQMMLGWHAPALPGFVARRQVPARSFARLVGRVVPALRLMEKVFRPRWPTPFRARQRIVGAVVLLLGLTLLVPIPLSNVIPALAVMLIALAYLEEDGLMLAIGLTAGCLSLAITAAMVWGAMAGIGLLNRL